MGNFNHEMFLEDLSNELNTSGLSDCNAVNEKFNNFFSIFKQKVDKHARLNTHLAKKNDFLQNHSLLVA